MLLFFQLLTALIKTNDEYKGMIGGNWMIRRDKPIIINPIAVEY